MEARNKYNLICYGILFAALVVVHYVIALNPDIAMFPSQRAMFSWSSIGILGTLGLLSVLLLNLTKLKGLWDTEVGINQKVILPFVIGLLAGLIQVVYDMFSKVTELLAASVGVESIHIEFPYSIPIYIGGAISVSILYYLVLIPIVVFLISNKLLKGKAEGIVFWSIAIPIALIEPLTNPGIGIIAKLGVVAAPLFVFSLFFQLLSILFIRKYGFISEIFLRIGFYIIYHILYPLL